MAVKFTKYDFLEAICLSPKVAIHKGDEIPFVEMANVATGNRKDPVAIEMRKFSGGTKFERNDTVIASIEPCLQHGKSFYFTEHDKGAGSTEYMVFRGIDDITTNEFVYYFMMSYEIREAMIRSMKGATGRQRVDPEVFTGLKIELPDVLTQNKIVAILSDYDAAIGNCRKQIALLEEAAMRLYREWAKKGIGKKVLLVDVVEVVYGFPFEGKLFNSKGDGLPIVRIRNVPEGESNDYTVETAPDRYVVRDGDLLIGMDGEFYVNFWSGGDAYLVQRTCRLRPNEARLTGFVREAIRKPIEEFQAAIVGSTVGHLGKRDIDTIKITMPTDSEFVELLQKGFAQQLNYRKQIRSLIEARDRLLPKLMNGEIEV